MISIVEETLLRRVSAQSSRTYFERCSLLLFSCVCVMFICLIKKEFFDNAGKNSTIIYSLTPPSEYFSVHQSVDENRYPHLKLVIEKELGERNDLVI